MRKTTILVLLAVAGAAPAHAQSGGSGPAPEEFFVAPGKYVLYDCPQLATAEARFVERDKELSRLMARAKEGPAGGLISAMVYDPDYYSNLGELRDVRREQREKNCGPNSKPGINPPPKPRR